MYCPGRIKLLRIIETMQKFLFSKGCVVVQSYVNQTNTSQRKAGKKQIICRIYENVLLKEEILPNYSNFLNF